MLRLTREFGARIGRPMVGFQEDTIPRHSSHEAHPPIDESGEVSTLHTTSSFDFSSTTLGISSSRHSSTSLEARRTRSATRVIHRRPTISQGRALETLGHAIEYLVDSRMHRDQGLSSQADGEAEQVIMRLNRAVFAECAEVVPEGPLPGWLRLWLGRVTGIDLIR